MMIVDIDVLENFSFHFTVGDQDNMYYCLAKYEDSNYQKIAFYNRANTLLEAIDETLLDRDSYVNYFGWPPPRVIK